MERTVLHCDLNNFYASVAALDNPSIRGCPIAVCGSSENRHGIVLAKNYEAKKFGIVTGETTWQAMQKCPDLITVLPDYDRYTEISKMAKQIYYRYSDLVEPFGIDECWLDVTGSRMLFGSGSKIADRIRREIKAELGITASVGVSFNKIFAKLGSDLKKPDAVTVITKENMKQKVWPLPAESIIGVGRSTLRQLHSLGIFTIGDIVSAGENTLKARFGKCGTTLYLFASGNENSPVAPEGYREIPKSVGRSTTYYKDLYSADEVWPILLSLSEDVAKTLRRNGLHASAVQMHIRTNELKVSEFQAPLEAPTQLGISLASSGMKLLCRSFDFSVPLRSVGIRAIGLKSELSAYQTGLFEDVTAEIRAECVEKRVYEIREKYGDDSIVRAATLKSRKTEKPASVFTHMKGR